MAPNEIIDREYRRAKRTYVAGIAILLVTVLLLVIGTVHFFSEKNNIVSLDSIIESNTANKTRRIAYLDMDGAFGFASDDTKSYYIAFNERYFYLVSIRKDDDAYVRSQFDQSDDAVRLYGWTAAIPAEAKQYAMESLNEELQEEFVDASNFEDVFGDVYLSITPESQLFGVDGFINISGGYAIGALFTLIAGLSLFFTGKARKKSFAPILDDGDSPLAAELNGPSATWYENLKTYVTDSYLVSLRGSLDAVRFEDIFWAYVTKHKTNGVPDYDFISLVTNDGRQLAIANSGSFGKKRKEETASLHAELLNLIQEKNPSAMIGYTSENLAAFQELQRQIKQKKKNGEL